MKKVIIVSAFFLSFAGNVQAYSIEDLQEFTGRYLVDDVNQIVQEEECLEQKAATHVNISALQMSLLTADPGVGSELIDRLNYLEGICPRYSIPSLASLGIKKPNSRKVVKSKRKKRKVTVRWNYSGSNNTHFKLSVRRKKRRLRNNLNHWPYFEKRVRSSKRKFKIKGLKPGKKYQWRMATCIENRCTGNTKWKTFKTKKN